MRALWLIRDDLTAQPGGDTTQILETAEGLRRLGVRVDLRADVRPSLGGYDVVHLFHLDRLWENEPHCRRIRAAGLPAVLSTIYWPADDYDRGGRGGLQGLLARTFGSDAYRSLRLVQRWAMGLPRQMRSASLSRPTWSFGRSARFCLQTMRAILPNSLAEQQIIERTLGVQRPAVVVPNAVSDEFLTDSPAGTESRDGVLCAGRIEPRKNQLALIRALDGTGIPLTFIGEPGRFSRDYDAACRREAGENVCFIGRLAPLELREWYQRSRVHVCPSWYETPGLATLEAAACGCAVVATPGGCTREYLEDWAYYCEPDDPASIRSAVEQALAYGPREELRQRIQTQYTWAAAAERTLEAYRLAVNSASSA